MVGATSSVDDVLRAEQRGVLLRADREKDEAYYRRSVLCIGFAFFGVFGGFQAAQGLQTSVNAELGFINLAVLYLTFSIVCLVAPPALAKLEDAIGLRIVMFVCSLAYVAMVISNVYTAQWALPISMNALVGVAAPLLWTSQNDYVGRCAYHAAHSSLGDGPVDEASANAEKSRMTAAFNGSFFSIYQFTGMFGTLAASLLMLALHNNDSMKDILFALLATLSLGGAFTFLCLPRVDRGGTSSEATPSIKATAALVADARVALMVPLIFTNGMTIAFLLGDYPTDVVCPVLGASFTGFVMATFFGVNSLATALWGRLAASKCVSRRTAYCLAGVFSLIFIVGKTLWRHPTVFEKHGGKWMQVEGREASWLDAVVVFALVATFAVGDAFWESGPAGTLQNYFLGSDSLVPAMANYKLWQSLGFAAQFMVGAEMGSYPVARGGLLAALVTVSVLCIHILDRKCPMT